MPGRSKVMVALVIIHIIALSVSACSPQTDPIDRLSSYVDEIIRLIKDPDPDIKAKKALVDEYWQAHRGELALIQKSLEDELSQAKDEREKTRFVGRYEKFLYRLKEFQSLLREQGIEW